MTARTRTAKKATDATPAPAKKATTKRTTPTKPRAPRTRAARNATPALSLVKEQTAQDDTKQPAATIVDLRHPLPVRRRLFVGPHTPAELAAIRAALASAAARLPVPVRSWNGPTAQLADGTVLTHTPTFATTDQPPAFTAAIRCRHGAVHVYPVHNALDLSRARLLAHQCDQRADQPKPPAVHALPEGVRRAEATKADTQPLTTAEITAGLEARADNDQAKEHPHG